MSSGMLANIVLLSCANALAGTIATGVSGSVHVTPAHPGPQRIGESGRAPLAGVTVLMRDENQRVVARMVTAKDGQFSASVPAGQYWLRVDVSEATLPRCGTAHAIVQDGRVAEVELECDSGMR